MKGSSASSGATDSSDEATSSPSSTDESLGAATATIKSRSISSRGSRADKRLSVADVDFNDVFEEVQIEAPVPKPLRSKDGGGGDRQRSSSWRDKIIRGSLGVDEDDDDIVIGMDSSDEDDSETDSRNDQVFAWGSVLEKHQAQPMPLRIGGMLGQDDFNVREMAAGDSHLLFLTEAGHVWALGKNNLGQLGIGESFKARSTPKLVMFLTDAMSTTIAACGNHSACLDESGRLYEWGQVQENRPVMSKPTVKAEFQSTRLEKIALGRHHTLASTSNGKIMTWGCNKTGALGIDYVSDFSESPCLVPIVDRAYEVAASSFGSACVTLKGSVYYWGPSWRQADAKVLKPTKMPFKEPVSSISLGQRHMLAVTVGNWSRVLSVGDNTHGQTGASTLGPISKGNSDFGEPIAVKFSAPSDLVASQTGSGGGGTDGGGSASSVTTRSARSVSIAVDAEGSGSLRNSSSGLRAALKKMSSKQSMAKQATQSSSDRPGARDGSMPALPPHIGGRAGRSFSLGGASAPKIRSRAEREADRAAELSSAASQSAAMVNVKSTLAGSDWSLVVTTDGQVWFMGAFQHGPAEADRVSYTTPSALSELSEVMIADIAGSDTCILASVGLRNEDDLKFQSFNPPTIRAASLQQLINWICTDKTKPDQLFVFSFVSNYLHVSL